jgi:hypothetical protein
LSLAVVPGANLSSTLPPLVEAGSAPARRLPLGNLLVRALSCVVILPFLMAIAGRLRHLEPAGARLAVDFHTAFNLVLAIAFLSFTGQLAAILCRLFLDPARPAEPALPVHLEAAALDSASVALANATRETLRMADMFETMPRGAIEVFQSGDRHRVDEISCSDRIGLAPRFAATSPILATSSRSTTRVRACAARRSYRRSLTSSTLNQKWLLRQLELQATGLHRRPTQAAALEEDSATTPENGDSLRVVRDLRRVHSHIAESLTRSSNELRRETPPAPSFRRSQPRACSCRRLSKTPPRPQPGKNRNSRRKARRDIDEVKADGVDIDPGARGTPCRRPAAVRALRR